MAAPQKKYVCTFCARAFTRSEHKQRHERSHTNEKPFHCLYCTSAFVRRDLLQRHCRTVHHIHRVPRKGLRGKDTSTPETIAPSKGAAKPLVGSSPESKLPEEKGLCMSVSTDEASSESSVESSTSATSSISSASTGASAVCDSPTSSSGSKDAKVNPALGDANLIASARVLLQLAPHKYEVGQAPYLSRLPQSSVTTSIAPNEGKSPKSPSFLPRSQEKIVMRPESISAATLKPRTPDSMYFDRLLQATKSLDQLCDTNGFKVAIADVFMLGFSITSKEPALILPGSRHCQCTFLDGYLQGAPFSDFDIVTGYTMSAIGAINMKGQSQEYEIVANDLMNKAWTFLVEYLIARHTLVENQLEVLKTLYFMAHTYLRYFKNDLIISYLEETATAVLKRIPTHQDSRELLAPYMDIIWNIYIIVSKHKANSTPPKFFAWILSQNIDDYFPLSHHMLAFSKGPAPLEDQFFAEIISCTFSNEVNYLIHKSSLAVFANRVELHAALSLALASVVNYSDAREVELFKLYKGKLLSECPDQMQVYLKSHLSELSKPWQFNILLLVLKELDLGRTALNFILEARDSRFDECGKSLIHYLSERDLLALSRGKLYEYLSNINTVTYSLILNSKLLYMKPFASNLDENHITDIESEALSSLVLEWYLSMMKMFISILTSLSTTELDQIIVENPIFQGLLFVTGNHPLLPGAKASDVIFHLFKNLTVVCDLWLDVHQSYSKEFRSNLSKFLNDLFLLASNNENFLINDVYISNGSISLNGKSSASKERRSLSLSIPLSSSLSEGNNLNGNYVLIKPKELLPPLNIGSMEKSSGAILPPLLAVPGLHLPQSSHNHRHSLLDLLSIAFLTVKNPPFVLPPLQHSLKTSLNDRPLLR